MNVSRFVTAAVVSIAALASGAGTAVGAESVRCGLGSEFRVISVEPLRETVNVGGYDGATNRVLRGADIAVAAQPGLTKEWLEGKVESQIAAGDCQFGVDNVSVDVLSAGDTFVVRLTNPDERAAKKIVRHASELTR